MPAICNFGIKLPIEQVVRRISAKSEIRFSVIDAAEAGNHVELASLGKLVDFTIAGSHKWIQSCAPLAFGLFGRKGSESFIKMSIAAYLDEKVTADPLMKFTERSDGQFGETLNLTGLFACGGALQDLKDVSLAPESDGTRQKIVELAVAAGWSILKPQKEFHSKILMIRMPGFDQSKGSLRRLFIKSQVAVSEFAGGYCRISIPARLDDEDLKRLQSALTSG